MTWLAAKLPLSRNYLTGYKLIKDYKELVKQNFKNLLLTVPGERMMIPDFGVGLKRFLFEPDGVILHDAIASTIKKQVRKYLPYLDIENIALTSADGDPYMDQHFLDIRVEYRIIPLAINDSLEITTTIN